MAEEGGPEATFVAHMREAREATPLSQAAVAAYMTDQGFKWHQATVYSVEKGERHLQLAEAHALAKLFKSSVDAMTRPERDERVKSAGARHWELHRRRVRELVSAVTAFEESRQFLQRWITDVGKPQGVLDTPLHERVTSYSAEDFAAGRVPDHDLKASLALLSDREATRRRVETLLPDFEGEDVYLT